MTGGGTTRLPGEHRGLAGLPAPRAADRPHRPAHHHRQRRQGLGPRVRAGWGRRRNADYLAMVVSTGVGGGIVLDGRLLDGADGNAGHIGHVVVEPAGAVVRLRRPGLPRGRGVGHGHRPGDRPPGGRGRSAGCASATGRLWAGPWPRWPTCSTCPSSSWRARSPWATATTSSPPPQAEIDERCRIEFSRGTVIRPGGLGADGPLIGAAAVGWRCSGLTRVSNLPIGPPAHEGRQRHPAPRDDEGWAFEIKWDGMRLLAYVDPDAASPAASADDAGPRRGPRYPELAGLAGAVGRPGRAGRRGRRPRRSGAPDFGRLQRHEDAVTFVASTSCWFDGNDYPGLAYLDRVRLAGMSWTDGDGGRVPAHALGDGAAWSRTPRPPGCEGLIAKRVDSPDLSGCAPRLAQGQGPAGPGAVRAAAAAGRGQLGGRLAPARWATTTETVFATPAGWAPASRGPSGAACSPAGRTRPRPIPLRRRAARAGPAPGPLRPP